MIVFHVHGMLIFLYGDCLAYTFKADHISDA